MIKNFLLVLAFIIAGGVSVNADTQSNVVNLVYKKIDDTPTLPQGGKAPARPWFITQDENVLTMSATPCDYTLTLYDEDGDVAYTACLPAGTTQIVLPTTLTGNFEIRLEADTYYYYGYILL